MAKPTKPDPNRPDPAAAPSGAPPPAAPPPAHPTGPWDVVMHFVTRFPVFALTLAVIGALFWGAGYIITQGTKAQNELAEARSEIAQERKDHIDALAALTAEANARIATKEAEANAAIQAASQAETEAVISVANADAAKEIAIATAEAKAYETVQNTLLDTSERIQALVEGQLSSMEELETVRSTTAAELNRQLADLQKRRQELEDELARQQEEIDQKDREIELAGVTLALDRIFETVFGEGSYRIDDEAENLAKTIELEDDAQVKRLRDQLGERNDPTISAAVYLAIFDETNNAQWFDRLREALTPVSFIQSDWLSAASWRLSLRMPEWSLLAALFMDEVTSGEPLAPGRRMVLLNFLSGALRYDFYEEQEWWKAPHMWSYIVKNVETLQTKEQDEFGQLTFDALNNLVRVAPAAAHVWAGILDADTSIQDRDREQLEYQIERLNDRGIEGPVSDAALIAFWTDPNLIDRMEDYPEQGTSDFYRELRLR